MSEFQNLKIEDSQTSSATQKVVNSELKISNGDSNVESSKLTKDYKFWARFNQVLVIIGGAFSLPFGASAIVAGIQLNKSIENVDNISKDAQTNNFVESVKSFHKWMVINVIVGICLGVLIGILFGALIFSAIMGGVRGDNLNSKFDNPSISITNKNRPVVDTPSNNQKDSTSYNKGFNVSNEEGSMVMDKDGNMKITNKDGKITSINIDGTTSTEK